MEKMVVDLAKNDPQVAMGLVHGVMAMLNMDDEIREAVDLTNMVAGPISKKLEDENTNPITLLLVFLTINSLMRESIELTAAAITESGEIAEMIKEAESIIGQEG